MRVAILSQDASLYLTRCLLDRLNLMNELDSMDALKLEDGSADDWLKQGQALFEQGDYEGAIIYENSSHKWWSL